MDKPDVQYRGLSPYELTPLLFEPFDRHQNVTECWRQSGGAWRLEPVHFVENWDECHKRILREYLLNTLSRGGAVFGAFCGELIGFTSVENELLGTKIKYVQLSSLHVSSAWRGRGVGKALFALSCRHALSAGAEKLYISAHSSKESCAFYFARGCVDAAEVNAALAAREPYDRQLEFDLGRTAG